ncbi:hypothetical protein [Nocardioides jiangxiensis]|uniref:Uncharacterized protein n=1 Tax=Nocardioides jiangxiensis TaxID=3064524 RepID=A0ABT9AZB9_9ACTN|nr:hypothetical protein [Nocardioides sp. WY-20]MDO7867934.1 hypothetical protein [Nocardioides sp. WY-20]
MRRSIVAVATALVAVVGAAAPARAESWTVRDRAGDVPDTGYSDIQSVTVVHRAETLDVSVSFAAAGGIVNAFVDTDRTDRGPEFRIRLRWRGDDFVGEVFAVERWRTPIGPGNRVACAGLETHTGYRLPDLAGVTVPRACLRAHGVVPRELRVAVRSWLLEADGSPVDIDWAPSRRSFPAAWVASA